MSEDRNRLVGQNDDSENEDVEAHRLVGATDDPDASDDNDVEAHRLA
jgi:hypothetical protein